MTFDIATLRNDFARDGFAIAPKPVHTQRSPNGSS